MGGRQTAPLYATGLSLLLWARSEQLVAAVAVWLVGWGLLGWWLSGREPAWGKATAWLLVSTLVAAWWVFPWP